MDNSQGNGLIKDVRNHTKRNYIPRSDDNVIFQNFGQYSLKGIIEETPLSKIFFSEMNMNVLQKAIRFNVNKKTNEIIDYQSTNELFTIMRSIFLQEGDAGVYSKDIAKHIRKLNGLVIEFAVHQISNQVSQHKEYLTKISTLPVPLKNPIYDNKQNFTFDISNLM